MSKNLRFIAQNSFNPSYGALTITNQEANTHITGLRGNIPIMKAVEVSDITSFFNIVGGVSYTNNNAQHLMTDTEISVSDHYIYIDVNNIPKDIAPHLHSKHIAAKLDRYAGKKFLQFSHPTHVAKLGYSSTTDIDLGMNACFLCLEIKS